LFTAGWEFTQIPQYLGPFGREGIQSPDRICRWNTDQRLHHLHGSGSVIAAAAMATNGLKPRQKIGKYRIEKRLGEGGFAAVYRAYDTIQGIRVALKVPHAALITHEVLDEFRREVRTTSQLEHDNILQIKDASIIDDRLVIVLPLGERTLDDRLRSRFSLETILSISGQLLDAVAYAHRNHVIHCDIKPENIILFSSQRIRLTDFGIAKVAQRTIRGSGTGTVGYMAPEQAMGKPSMRSDVFSIGLIMYRMLSGHWPEWPFLWPGPGYARLKARVHPELLNVLKKATDPNPRKRYADAVQFQTAVAKTRTKALNFIKKKRRPASRLTGR
jgi:serine/threonine protein kinase